MAILREAFPAAAVTSRASLEDYLSQSLLSEYIDRVGGRTRQVATSLKSYLVEAHLTAETAADILAAVFARIEHTHDSTLLRAFDNRGIPYFVDLRDDRYPFVHTIGHTNLTDVTIDKLVRQPFADRCWLPSRLLLSQEFGRMIGFRFFHQRRVSGLDDSEFARQLAMELGRETAPAFRMAVSEYANAAADLEALRTSLPLGRRAAIESLSWRSAPRDVSETFIHDHVWGTGKVVAYGTSWGAHVNNILSLRDNYRSAVETLETEFALDWAENGLRGVPMQLSFGAHSPIREIRALVADLCSGREPFRLIGSWQEAHDGVYVINAIDTHVGQKVDLEVAHEFIRVYLPTGSCGNVLMRLLFNIERYLSSELEASFEGAFAS